MAVTYYVDTETYEVYENPPGLIPVDVGLAKTIAILNQKGYKTAYCCSGHYKTEYYEYFNVDIKKLASVQNDKDCVVKKINKDTFDYWHYVNSAYTYILFKENYNFDIIPEGFDIELTDNKINISHITDYFDEKHQKRTTSEIYKEIEKYCKILENWANNLPSIN